MSEPQVASTSPAEPVSEGRHDHVLSLTVHAQPTLADVVAEDSRRTATGRLKMLMVMLLCASPVIASYFTYYVLRPEGRRNFGELIDPQRPLPELNGHSLDGSVASLRSLKGQWLLISVSGADCDAACERHLYLQRQLREGLGKDKDRVDWVWLIDDEAPVNPGLLSALKTATVLRVSKAQLAAWLAPAQGQPLAAHLYVVDPLGNWMMRFPPGMDAASAGKVKRDLERLLRASAFWDRAGR